MFPKDGPLPHDKWRAQLAELGRPKATLVDSVPKPQNLMEMYRVDAHRIYQDLMDRPSHYTPEQKALVEALHFKRIMPIEPTPAQLDDLFYRFVERTEQVKKRQQILKKVTDISDVAEFEGDMKPKDPKDPNYEDQNYGKLIKLI